MHEYASIVNSNNNKEILLDISSHKILNIKEVERIICPVFYLKVNPNTTIAAIKQQLYELKKAPYVQRQSLRLDAKGKALADSETVKSLSLRLGAKLYYKDLGPQIGWKTVFLVEYAGPLIVYLWLYQRPWLFYGDIENTKVHYVVK